MSSKHASFFLLFTSWVVKTLVLIAPLGEIAGLSFRSSGTSLTPFAAWLGVFALALQAYLAVSATADLAAALALLSGRAERIGGFDASYRSRSITEFWQRWLQWLTPGHSFVGLSIVVTAVAGCLHFNLSLSQLVWALLMAALVWLEAKTGGALWLWLPGPLRSLTTFAVLLFSWVWLRAANLEHALLYYRALAAVPAELNESALILEAQVSSDSNLLLLLASLIIVIVLPSVQSLIEPIKRWKLALAAVPALILMASAVAPAVRTQLSGFLHHVLQRGNPAVFAGRGGWLFDTRELEALTGSGPLDPEISAPRQPKSDAVATITDFARQLKERGVPLLLIPLPMKASIYPEYITGSDPEASEAPLYHSRQPALYEQLAQAGIDVQDITQAMLQLKERKTPVFFRQDSRWTPEAMQVLAKAIADQVRKKYPGAAAEAPMIIDAKAIDGVSHGDLAAKLHLAASGSVLMPEKAVMLSFPGIENQPDAPVTLLGDDFVQLFDDPSLGFAPKGASAGQPLRAGFAQHLALYLGRRIDGIIHSPSSVNAVRTTLAGRIMDDVRAKKLVIWLLPVRDLIAPPSAGIDWHRVPLSEVQRPPETITPLAPKP